MTNRFVAPIIASLLSATATFAQDASDLSGDQLVDGIRMATEEPNADRLLELMQEARNRQMFMFRVEREICEDDVPKLETGPLSTLSWGRFRITYIQFAQRTAVEQAFCGCPFELVTFGEFTQELVGKTPAELERSDLPAFNTFNDQNFGPVREAYQSFQTNVCGR